MSTPVAIVGLTFRGYDPQRPDLDVFFEITEGLDELPEMRGEDQLIPFRTGQLPGLRLAHRRPVVLTGHIMGSGSAPRSVYRAYVDGLKGIFDPAAGPGILAATLPDGTNRWINAVARNIIGGEGFGGEFRSLSIELEALDPYWYGAWGTLAMDAGYELDAGEVLDSSAEVVIVPTSANHAIDIDALGTAEIERLRFTMTGPSTGPPGFYVTIGGVEFGWTFGGPGTIYPALVLPAGQVLIVDNYARTVTLNDPGSTVLVPYRNLLVLRAGNARGEYARFRVGVNACRVTGFPAECRIQLTPTWN